MLELHLFWDGGSISVKFEGVSLTYPECGLDYMLISIKCEIFLVKLLNPEPPGWI
jgi:hypothetical protein